MSTVVVVNGANSGKPQPNPVLPPLEENNQQKKDSAGTRMTCGVIGTTAVAGGIVGQLASWNAGDKFTSLGKSGQKFDETLMSLLNPKNWGRAIKANPQGFLGFAALKIASCTSLVVGSALVKRAFTGHESEKKKHKS